jgi:hypothetical protein
MNIKVGILNKVTLEIISVNIQLDWKQKRILKCLKAIFIFVTSFMKKYCIEIYALHLSTKTTN